MQDPLKRIIDKAAEMCGSQNKLAETLGISKGTLSGIKSGDVSMPEHTIRALAEMLHMRPGEVWEIAADGRKKGTEKAPLKRGTRGALPSIAAAVLSLAVWDKNPAQASTYAQNVHLTSHTLSRLMRRLRFADNAA